MMMMKLLRRLPLPPGRGWKLKYALLTPAGEWALGFEAPGPLWREVRVRDWREALRLVLELEELELE